MSDPVTSLFHGLPPGRPSREEEADLATTIQTYAQGKRREAALSKLVLSHMRDAFFYARRCCRGKMSDGDIFSVCYAALSHSAKNFKPHWSRYFAFSKPYIRGSLLREWKKFEVVKNSSEHEEPEEDGPQKPVADPSVMPEFDSIHTREMWKLVQPLVNRLTKQERRIIQLHYGDGLNFVEIAAKYAVTRERIRQIEARALRKVRVWLMNKNRFLSQ